MSYQKKTPGVEGEGSYSATHRYNAGVKKSVEAGNTEALAEDARKALEGPEGEALREAERIAKRGNPKEARSSK